jgi:hypothetical protein
MMTAASDDQAGPGRAGNRLGPGDEGWHAPGAESNWNESRYLDFGDPSGGLAGWLRLGMRPNEGHAEMSVCIHLPDGRTAFSFRRVPIDGNGMEAGGQRWEVLEPYRRSRVGFRGDLAVLDDSWAMTEPKTAFRESHTMAARVDLEVTAHGLAQVLGADQAHVDRIFLPGQADWHYQHLCATVGTVQVGADRWDIAGTGARDHSWGPRHWHAKTWFRWLTCADEELDGFLLTRAVGPTERTRGGAVVEAGRFILVDDFRFDATYGPPPQWALESVTVTAVAGANEWTAVGRPEAWMPLRHRQPAEAGGAVLRIVKSPTAWSRHGRGSAAGHCEWHDLLADGVPTGLAE